MPIKSSETNSHSYPQLLIDANQNQVVQNSHLTPWFWLMPDRSYNHSSYHLYFYWKLRMDCFVTTFIFDEMQGFPPKEGMSWNSFPSWSNSELFIWPTELHILFHYGAMNLSFSIRRSSHSLHEHEVSWQRSCSSLTSPWSFVPSRCESYNHLRVNALYNGCVWFCLS